MYFPDPTSIISLDLSRRESTNRYDSKAGAYKCTSTTAIEVAQCFSVLHRLVEFAGKHAVGGSYSSGKTEKCCSRKSQIGQAFLCEIEKLRKKRIKKNKALDVERGYQIGTTKQHDPRAGYDKTLPLLNIRLSMGSEGKTISLPTLTKIASIGFSSKEGPSAPLSALSAAVSGGSSWAHRHGRFYQQLLSL